jgi:diguanylate cyclase (GGDEF)-like protein
MNDTQVIWAHLEKSNNTFYDALKLSAKQKATAEQYIKKNYMNVVKTADAFFDGRLLFEPEQQTFYANNAFLHWLGYNNKTRPKKARWITQTIHQDDQAALITAMKSAETSKKEQALVIRFLGKTKKTLWAIVRIQKVSSLVVCLLIDITAQKQLEAALKKTALHDDLTTLPNRASFYAALHRAISRAGRRKQQFALLYIDVDNFKAINDTMGHSSGDKMLKRMAEALKEAVRDEDFITRIGGDEFTVIAEDINTPLQAAQLAKRIIEKAQKPILIGKKKLACTTSIGIALFPSGGKTAEELIRHADAAMYSAKQRGRNDFRFYSEEKNQEIMRKSRIETELHSAIQEEGLFLETQPIIDLKKKHCIGLETLIRWDHEDLGEIAPKELIAIAEETGLMRKLGLWVIEKTLDKFSSLSQQLPQQTRTMQITVNLSRAHLLDETFPLLLQQLLQQYNLPPACLILEISESALIGILDEAAPALNQLHDIGVVLAIDNFGTGHLSIMSVSQTPISIIKLDRSFIEKVVQTQKQKKLLQTIIHMGKHLNFNIIAGGVETEQQLQLLLELGCYAAQGYFISKPLLDEDLVGFLEKQVETP